MSSKPARASKLTPVEQLCLSCCRDKDKRVFFSLPSEWVEDAKDKKLVKFTRDYYIKYSEFPPEDEVRSMFGISGEYPAIPGHYYTLVQEAYVKFTISQIIPRVAAKLNDDALAALNQLRTSVTNIKSHGEESTDVVYSEDATTRYQAYKNRKGKGGISYLSTGFDVLDKLIYGYERTDLITFGGRAGTQKTWLMITLALALERVLPPNFGPILFITNEMSAEQIIERMDSIRFTICYDTLLRGELSRAESKRYLKGLKDLEATPSRMIVIDGVNTLDALEEKYTIYQPSIGFVDGSYLLEPQMEEGYAKTVFITRNLKGASKRHKIPTINSTQLRKGKGKSKYESSADSQDDFYHGSYTQDSDFAFRMFRTPKMEIYGEVGMQIAKGRRVPPGTLLHWELSHVTMQSSFEVQEPDNSYDDSDSVI